MTATEQATQRRAPWPIEFYRSAVGKKWVMAITGIVLIGFVVGHLLGNLKVYFGAEERVDFRELVRELAGRLKVRVELRQMGPRDEAKLIGGFDLKGHI